MRAMRRPSTSPRAAVAALALLFASCAASPADDPPQDRWLEYRDHQGPGRGKHIVLIAGEEEYRSEESFPMLAHLLAKRHGFDTTVLFSQGATTGIVDPGERRHIVGLEMLDDADLVVLSTRFRAWDPDEMQHLDEYLRGGGSVIGVRTATHAFEFRQASDHPFKHYSWDSPEPPGGFGGRVLGTTWVAHHGVHEQQSTRGVVEAGAADHPILRGVGEVWAETDVYEVQPLPADAVVLMRGVVLDGMEPDSAPAEGERYAEHRPVAWARDVRTKSGAEMRIVTTTMGSARDFRDENLRRLFVNACYWATRLDDAVPELANVHPMEFYTPSPSGFGKHLVGMHPIEMRPASRGVHRW